LVREQCRVSDRLSEIRHGNFVLRAAADGTHDRDRQGHDNEQAALRK
jgi:hypothetical protein